MSIHYTREQLQAIIAARYGQPEGQGGQSYIEFKIKVTPELLEAVLGGHWVPAPGDSRIQGITGRVELDSVWLTDDGYLEPVFKAVVPA